MIKCYDCGDKLKKADLNLCIGCNCNDYCRDCIMNHKGKKYCAACYEWYVVMPKEGWKPINSYQKTKIIKF